jgi:hypothetical protein
MANRNPTAVSAPGPDEDERALERVQPQSTALALPTQESLALVREALGPGESLTVDLLERAKVPAGGASSWDVVNGDPTRTIEGVLVLRQVTRVYWRASYAETGGGQQPDCSSLDAQYGHGDRGLEGDTVESVHECAKCPLGGDDAWGTATNEKGQPMAGKACRQVTRIFMLRPGDNLPMLIALPPSSYKPALAYAVQMAGKKVPYYGGITAMTLEKAKSKGANGGPGVDYSKAVFKPVRPLTPEEFVQVQAYRDQFVPFFTAMSVVEVEAQERNVV